MQTNIPKERQIVNNRIPTVEKTIQILQLLANTSQPLHTKALAAEVGASPSTCYRILKTLQNAGWVGMDEQGAYEIGKGLLPITEPLYDLRQAVNLARPILRNLANELKVTVKLSAPQGDLQVTILVETPAIPISILSPAGIPYPIVEAATGAAMLSYLDEKALEALIKKTPKEHWQRHKPNELKERVKHCREYGWCHNIGTHPQGIDAIACPIKSGTTLLALGMIGLRGDFNTDALPKLKDKLLEAQSELEAIFNELTAIY